MLRFVAVLVGLPTLVMRLGRVDGFLQSLVALLHPLESGRLEHSRRQIARLQIWLSAQDGHYSGFQSYEGQ